MNLKTVLILSSVLCVSLTTGAADEIAGQCFQTTSTSPVYDFTFKVTSDTGTGLLSANAVPWKNLTCVRLRGYLECTNPEKYLLVTVGASEVAHVVQDGRNLVTLSCRTNVNVR